MGFSTDFIRKQQDLAVEALIDTGCLPDGHFWDTLEQRNLTNPAFDEQYPIVGVLLDRDLRIHSGQAPCNAPLFPDTPFFLELGRRFDANPIRFNHYHGWLSDLIQLDRAFAAGFVPENCCTEMPPPPAAIPEPSTLGMVVVGMLMVVTLLLRPRRLTREEAPRDVN